MIDRYTIKFGPAVSQKELEKALYAPLTNAGDTVLQPGQKLVLEAVTSNLHKMKARIEFVGDFEDVQKVADFIKQRAKMA